MMKYIDETAIYTAEYIENDIEIMSYIYTIKSNDIKKYDNISNLLNNSVIMSGFYNIIKHICIGDKYTIRVDIIKRHSSDINKYLEYLDSIIDMYINGDGHSHYASLYKLGIVKLDYNMYTNGYITDITINEIDEKNGNMRYVCTYYLKPGNIWATIFQNDYELKQLCKLIPIWKVTNDSISYKMKYLNTDIIVEISEILDMYIKINKKINTIVERMMNNV